MSHPASHFPFGLPGGGILLRIQIDELRMPKSIQFAPEVEKGLEVDIFHGIGIMLHARYRPNKLLVPRHNIQKVLRS